MGRVGGPVGEKPRPAPRWALPVTERRCFGHPSAASVRWPVKMMKKLAFAGAAVAVLAACSEAPEPQPDPALIERIALANTASPDAPKLEKADRIVKAIDRSDPDRLAAPAEALLAR